MPLRRVTFAFWTLALSGIVSLHVLSFQNPITCEPFDTDRRWTAIDIRNGYLSAYMLSYNFDGKHGYLQKSLRPGAKLQRRMLIGRINPKDLSRVPRQLVTFIGFGDPPGRYSTVRFVSFHVLLLAGFVAVPFGLILALRLIRRTRRTLRSRNSLCKTCTYDLTGNTSGRCPECGTPIHAANSRSDLQQTHPVNR